MDVTMSMSAEEFKAEYGSKEAHDKVLAESNELNETAHEALKIQNDNFLPDATHFDDLNEDGIFAPVTTVSGMHGLRTISEQEMIKQDFEEEAEEIGIAAYEKLLKSGLIQKWSEDNGVTITPEKITDYLAIKNETAKKDGKNLYHGQWAFDDYHYSKAKFAEPRGDGRGKLVALFGEKVIAPETVNHILAHVDASINAEAKNLARYSPDHAEPDFNL